MTTPATYRQPRGLQIFLTLVGILFVSGIGFLITITIGRVQGEEFSPQSFFVREFHYYRLPYFQTRITGTTLPNPAGSLACPTTISSHLTAGIGTNVRWDLADYQFQGGKLVRNDASILLTYLEEPGSDEWEEWTTDKPQLAKILWPAVQDLAIQHCYFAIPELMDAAKGSGSPAELQSSIRSISLRAAELAAQGFENSKDSKKASEIAVWGLKHGRSSILQTLAGSASSSQSSISVETQGEVEAFK